MMKINQKNITMGELIKKKIADCNAEIIDLESRIYEKGKRKADISDEYFEEKYNKIKEQKRQKKCLERIDVLCNVNMRALLLSAYERNYRNNAIIVAFFENGQKVVYRGCEIDWNLTTNDMLAFESDAGLGCLNINKFASISFAFYETTYEDYVPELVESNGTLVKPIGVEEIKDFISDYGVALMGAFEEGVNVKLQTE